MGLYGFDGEHFLIIFGVYERDRAFEPCGYTASYRYGVLTVPDGNGLLTITCFELKLFASHFWCLLVSSINLLIMIFLSYLMVI